MVRPLHSWRLRDRELELGRRTFVMGVLNVTPDSFSDGGLHLDTDAAVQHGLKLLDDGADILDIGGESTRPGVVTANGDLGLAGAVTADVELQRILPVIQAIKNARPNSLLSVDTYKAEVAREAANAGVEIVNDVSGFTWDASMGETIAQLRCGAVLMHVRGRPHEWRSLPPEPEIVKVVERELSARVGLAQATGIARDSLVLDPGFGFGKNFEENYPLLAHFGDLHKLGFPLLAATSRKSFLGHTVGRRWAELSGGPEPLIPPEKRGAATLASCVAAVLQGAHIVRVHEVRETVEAVAVADEILNTLNGAPPGH